MVTHDLFLHTHSIIPTVYVRTHNETNNTFTCYCLDVGIRFMHKHDLEINQTLVNDLSLGVLKLIYISTVTTVCSTKTVQPQVKTIFILFHKTVGKCDLLPFSGIVTVVCKRAYNYFIYLLFHFILICRPYHHYTLNRLHKVDESSCFTTPIKISPSNSFGYSLYSFLIWPNVQV